MSVRLNSDARFNCYNSNFPKHTEIDWNYLIGHAVEFT